MDRVVLSKLCKPDQIGKYGIPASAEPFSEKKTRYLRISDIDDYGNLLREDKKSVSADDIEKYILEEGDLVVARTGNSTGRTYYHEKRNGQLAFAGFLIKYGLDKDKVNPKYLKYFTVSSEYKQWVKNLSVGSTRGNINAQTFAECPILLPNRGQQDLLVKVLSSLDDKIEFNNRINEQLEQMAKTLYDYWFVQFDFPNAEGKPYKSSGGEMVYSEVLKRDIPMGFKESEVGEIAKLIRGVSYSKNDIENNLTEKNIKILRATNITGNKIDLNNPIIVSKDFVSKDQILKKFDILITMSSGSIDHIGKNGFYYFGDEVSFGAFCAKLVANDTYKYFLLSYMQSSFVSSTIKNECLGTNINNLNGAMVNAFKIIKPPHNILQKFNEIVIPLHEKISVNLQQNQQLAQLRDWLLPMLMNGQVTVGEAEEMVEDLGMVAEERGYYN